MDIAQSIFILIAVALAGLLIFLGVQVYYILREVRTALRKANKVLNDVEIVVTNAKSSVERLTNLTNGIKVGGVIMSLISAFRKRKKEEE